MVSLIFEADFHITNLVFIPIRVDFMVGLLRLTTLFCYPCGCSSIPTTCLVFGLPGAGTPETHPHVTTLHLGRELCS